MFTEWEMRGVYITCSEEVIAKVSVSLSESPSVPTFLYLIIGSTNLSARAPSHNTQCLTSVRTEDLLDASKPHCCTNCNLLKRKNQEMQNQRDKASKCLHWEFIYKETNFMYMDTLFRCICVHYIILITELNVTNHF